VERVELPPALEAAWNRAWAFDDRWFPGWRSLPVYHFSNALIGEAGEVANAIKHRAGGGTKKVEVSAEEVLTEITDTFNYYALLGERVGWRFGQVWNLADLGYKMVFRPDPKWPEERLSNRLAGAVGQICRVVSWTSESGDDYPVAFGNAVDVLHPNGKEDFVVPPVLRSILELAEKLGDDANTFARRVDATLDKCEVRMADRVRTGTAGGSP
jgi:NTP pyrophosphatase (non-canonical NTP hydrolase)